MMIDQRDITRLIATLRSDAKTCRDQGDEPATQEDIGDIYEVMAALAAMIAELQRAKK